MNRRDKRLNPRIAILHYAIVKAPDSQVSKTMKHAVLVALTGCFVGAQMLAPTLLLAEVLRCKIESYNEDIFITTSAQVQIYIDEAEQERLAEAAMTKRSASR